MINVSYQRHFHEAHHITSRIRPKPCLPLLGCPLQGPEKIPTDRAKGIQIRCQQVCGSDTALRRQMLTLSPLASTSSEDSYDLGCSPGLGRDKEDIEFEWDLAVTHNRNEELRQRTSVKQFFAKISTIESLCDQETRDWLGSLPHHMRREVIPLFESSIDGVFEDYQLYPSYSWLIKGKIAKNPDLDFYHLSCVENTEPQMGGLFMPLGRLFVNADNGNHFNERCNSNRSRLTRWTGYEVFISNDMAIWIVFDGHSFASHARPWYPVSCGITEPFEPGIARLPTFA